jgi:cysteine desulfurase
MKAYLDNNATTQMLPEAVEAMMPYLTEKYGNPSSLHYKGVEADDALSDFRGRLAKLINAEPEEIIFTGGATEANNIAIWGAALASKKRHVITSAIEHSSVHNPLKRLERQGWRETVLPVDREGFVSLEQLRNAITPDTSLVSIMHANHEIGTIQDIAAIGRICRERGVLFHTDAAQSFTKVPIDVKRQAVDLLTINAHKIHGPRGVGALYVRRGLRIEKVFDGGPQEFNMRPGTENVAGIAGFVKAAEAGIAEMAVNVPKMAALRNMLVKELLTIPHTHLNGPALDSAKRLPNNANVTFCYVEGEAILMRLSMEGICVSTGSACSSKALQPSHVLTAIGLKHEDAHGSVRFSVSKFNTGEEMRYAAEKTKEAVAQLREITSFTPELEKKEYYAERKEEFISEG